MRRNHGNQNRFPGLYRNDVLEKCRRQADLTIKEVSLLTGVKLDSTRRVFLGEAHQKQVRPIADFFKVDWSLLHDLSLPLSKFEFDRAVLNTSSKAVRSSGPAQVGVRRPAPLKRGRTYTASER